jgi:[acyl-carrier-protein] S-malonyltransferase
MAVVLGLPADAVEELVYHAREKGGQKIWVANLNCPGQVVISGTHEGIALATTLAKEKGAKRILPLQVQGAFHSGLMAYAEERLRPRIDSVSLHAAKIPVVMNVTAEVAKSDEELRHLLVKQVTHSVRWEASLHTMARESVSVFVEIGCGSALTGFVKRSLPEALAINIDKVDDLKPFETFVQGLE